MRLRVLPIVYDASAHAEPVICPAISCRIAAGTTWYVEVFKCKRDVPNIRRWLAAVYGDAALAQLPPHHESVWQQGVPHQHCSDGGVRGPAVRGR